MDNGVRTAPGGVLRLADDLVLSRMGFGAMQLAGPGVFGPPRDRDQALAILREAVNNGVTHIDTSDFYGPVVVNELIREALHPYPGGPAHRHQGGRPPRHRRKLAPLA
jgi:Predicted oxidoreductases (related to aryl-alcohol dehydrogenases)